MGGRRELPEDWLEPHLARVPAGVRVLDLGCGPGWDSAALRARGFEVISTDRADSELARARIEAGTQALLRVDHSRPLPFRDAAFAVVVASLSLHYLPWADTLAAFEEVHRVLQPGGRFLFRVNATDDVEFGALEGIEVEPGLRQTTLSGYSETKRFFDEAAVRAAASRFAIESLRHMTIARYAKPKRVWECCCRRP